MHIAFVVNPVFGGWQPTDARLGGTEEAVVHWAEEFVKMGHTAVVYRNSFGPSVSLNGVPYIKREHFLSANPDVVINVKSHDIQPGKVPMLYVTNETNADKFDLSMYAGIVWPSEWARDNIPVNNHKTFIVPHGYDPAKIYPGDKIFKQCFYASSPDRGLETLLKAWPKVYKVHPDATLILTYGAQASDLPGVIALGNVDEETMNDVYRTSDIWCHPANGGELYCITGIKAQAAGCVPVVVPTMALSETVKYGYKLADGGDYADMLIEALDNARDRQYIREQLATVSWPTYAESAKELMAAIQAVLQSR